MTKLADPPSISIFFPVFNDQTTVAALVKDALDVAQSFTANYEVLLIDDGSTDRSAAIADDLAASLENVRVIHHAANQGYGAALRTGFGHATKDLVFYTDGDGQYDVRELLALFPLMTDDVGAVNGYKIRRRDNPIRRAAGAAYNRVARFLFRLPIRDVDCDFRLLRRPLLERISLKGSSGVICVELVHQLALAGCVFKEAPVHHYARTGGTSTFFTPRRVTRTLVDFFALWWNQVAFRRAQFRTSNHVK